MGLTLKQRGMCLKKHEVKTRSIICNLAVEDYLAYGKDIGQKKCEESRSDKWIWIRYLNIL